MRRLAFLALTLATGCSDALEKTSSAGQVIGVINAFDLSLVSATDFSVTTRSWPGTTAGPSAIAGGGRTFVVTLEQANAVGVSLLVTCPPDPVALCARPDYVLPLRAGSEPDGVAIQDDSIAWIANRALNSVTRLNYFTGDTTSVAAGVFPRAVVLVGSRVFVVNSNLVGGVPAGPSWLTSFECCGVRTPDSIPLTGLAAGFAVVGDDSLLYVVAAGRSGAADGKLSIVDPKRRTEVAVLNGLGESPGAVVLHPTGSRLLIASDREGILEVNTSIRAVTRAPERGRGPALLPRDARAAHSRRLRPREPAARPGRRRRAVRWRRGARRGDAQDGAPGTAPGGLRHAHRRARCPRRRDSRTRGRHGRAVDLRARSGARLLAVA